MQHAIRALFIPCIIVDKKLQKGQLSWLMFVKARKRRQINSSGGIVGRNKYD